VVVVMPVLMVMMVMVLMVMMVMMVMVMMTCMAMTCMVLADSAKIVRSRVPWFRVYWMACAVGLALTCIQVCTAHSRTRVRVCDVWRPAPSPRAHRWRAPLPPGGGDSDAWAGPGL
jgi:hypothetical protein